MNLRWMAVLVGLLMGIATWYGAAHADSPTQMPPVAGETRLVTVGMNGEPSNGHSTPIDMSADGRWLLVASYATNLAPDREGNPAYFLYDLDASVAVALPTPNNATTKYIGLSDDGQWFLVQLEGQSQLYIYDRGENQFERIRANNGQLPNGGMQAVDFSADGRFALFYSDANNLVAGDSNFQGDLFLYDRTTRQSVIVTKASDGTLANAETRTGAVGADGRYVVFSTAATNLVTGDSNHVADIFRHDTTTGETVRVSVRSGGAQLYTPSVQPSVSRDGRYISFITDATDCELPAAPLPSVLCLRDVEADETRRISRRTDGSDPIPGMYDNPTAQVAADGNTVTISAPSTWDLVPEDTNHGADVYQYWIADGTLNRVTVGNDERESSGDRGVSSADGQRVAFQTYASNLGTFDPNAITDVYLRVQDFNPPPTPTPSATPTRMANSMFLPMAAQDRPLQTYPLLQGQPAVGDFNTYSSVSQDGAYVAFTTETGLVPEDIDGGFDAYVWSRRTDTYELASISSTGTPAVGVYFTTLAAEGRYLIFATMTSLVSEDTNSTFDFYRRDLETDQTEWVSYGSQGVSTNLAAISANGERVAFWMSLNNLATVYVRDMTTGATTAILKENGSPFTYTESLSFSADGTTVLVAEPRGNTPLCAAGTQLDFYQVNTSTGKASPVLQSTPTLGILSATLSGDGQTIAYGYIRPDRGYLRLGVRLRQSDGSEVTVAEYFTAFQYVCQMGSLALSHDGRYVAFGSRDLSAQTPDYLPDTNGWSDIYLYDHQQDYLRRISVPGGAEGQGQSNGESFRPAVSANGKVVSFFSQASTLVPGTSSDSNESHLFVWGR